MNTLYRNELEADLGCSVSDDKEIVLGLSINDAYNAIVDEATDENGDVVGSFYFAENAELFKELAQQLIEAVDGKFIKEYKLKGSR